MSLEHRFAEGLARLGLVAEEPLIRRSLRYLELISRWNRVTNLTSITDPAEMVTHHLLDSLSLHPHLSGQRILDVGSGAGLPGIPLALFNPGKDFILLDSNGKKTRFMTQSAIELEIANVQVVHARVEDHAGHYDQLVTRAFSPLSEMLRRLEHLFRPGISLLAMKGPGVQEEAAAVDDRRWQVSLQQLHVPGIEAERFVAIVGLRT